MNSEYIRELECLYFFMKKSHAELKQEYRELEQKYKELEQKYKELENQTGAKGNEESIQCS